MFPTIPKPLKHLKREVREIVCVGKSVRKHFSIKADICSLRGGIKKNKLVFFRKTPKGGRGGLAQSKISLSEKTEIFLDFFSKGGGGLT